MSANSYKSAKPGLAFMFGLCAAAALPLLLLQSTDDAARTGEENLDNIIPFEQIQKEGDVRIQRVISLMRQSDEGEKIYKYAASSALTVQWNTQKSSASGTYENGRIKLQTSLSDKSAALTLGHEIRHHWQANIMPLGRMVFDPVMLWQHALLEEVDACAYSAHYAAQYKDKTGTPLIDVPGTSFGDSTAYSYSQIPPQQRDFFRQAVIPCFAELAQYSYATRYLEKTQFILERTQALASNIKKDPQMLGHLIADMKSVSDEDKAALLSPLFSLSLDDDPQPLPEIAAMSVEEFVSWIEKMTMADPELAKKIKDMGHEFDKIQPRLTKKNPAPSS